MPATVYGDINFGLLAETGLYVESVEFETQIESYFVGDEQGADVAGATFNSSASFALNGFTKTTEELTAKTGEAIVLANALDWTTLIVGATANGGQTIIESVKTGLNHKNAQTRNVEGVFKPFMEAVQTPAA